MSTLTLQTSLPWTRSHEEDRRFRLILLQTLLICLAAGAITPYIKIPVPDPGAAEELPPRRVRLLAEPVTPVLRPGPEQEVPAVIVPPQPQPQPQPQPVTERPVPAPVVSPRQKAAQTGVLAMSDALAELHGTVPKTGTASRQDIATVQGRTAITQPSILITDVTRGSQGIEGGVAHQSVLGESGLPDRQDSRQGASNTAGVPAARTHASASVSGMERSREEIQEILDGNKGAMYSLYNRELRKDATLQGWFVVSITIAPSGKVTRCVILSSDLGAASLEQQLVSLIKRIDFGNKPGVPAVTTKVPIEFLPR